MNFEQIKPGFVNFLENQRKSNPNLEKYEDIDYSNINIFEFADEFKDYVDGKYNSTNSIKTMSINDVLKMEVQNGKLVTQEELEEMDKAKEDADNGIDTSESADSTSQNTTTAQAQAPATTQATGGAQTAGTATGEAAGNAATAVPPAPVPATAETAPAENNATEQNVAEEDGTENKAKDFGEKIGEFVGDVLETGVNLVTGLLGSLLENSNFLKAFDADGNKQISTEELGDFVDTTKGLDGNFEDLSLNDILNGMDKILNNENIAEIVETGLDFASDIIDNILAPVNTQGTSGNSSNGGYSNNSVGGGKSTGGNNNAQKAKTLDNMSLNELKTELGKANNTLGSEKEELSAIKDGSNTELKGLQENIDKAYDDYQKQLKEVDEKLAQEVDNLKSQIDQKDQAIGQQENAISQQESTIASAQSAYDNAESTATALKGRKGALEAQAAAEQDPAKKATITAMIAELEAEIVAAEAAKEKAKAALDAAKEALTPLKEALTQLKNEKANLEGQMQAKETEIRDKHPEVAQSLDKYKEAQKTYDDKEKALTTEAQKGVKEAQDHVTKVEKEINERQIEEKLSKYQTDDYNKAAGEKLADAAKNSKWGKTTQGQKRCATGVADIFNGVYGTNYHGNGCDWDSNMDDMVDKGYFKEVTSDYPSASDLSSLPAGAVVCWEATTGQGNGGARYGHVAIADGNGGEISDHYSKNIYTKIGGRSDNYKVYIPIK